MKTNMAAGYFNPQIKVPDKGRRQTANVKLLTANRGLPVVVRSPSVDLEVSNVFPFLRRIVVEEALMRMGFKWHFSQKETNPRSQGPYSGSSLERTLLKSLRMTLVEVRLASKPG